MKKIMITLMSVFMIACFTNSVYATDFPTHTAGATIDIPDTNGGSGDSVEYTPSPGTIIDGAAETTVFTIVTCNDKADADGIIYSVISADNVIYQSPQADGSDGTMPALTITVGSAPSSPSFTAKN